MKLRVYQCLMCVFLWRGKIQLKNLCMEGLRLILITGMLLRSVQNVMYSWNRGGIPDIYLIESVRQDGFGKVRPGSLHLKGKCCDHSCRV